MSDEPMVGDPITAIGVLAEPNRLRLYELVVRSADPVGRDEAASSFGMSRELAAFHLERLVDAGLLETELRRLGGRSGPGAGRPAKLYRRAGRDIAVSLPPRRYDRAADLMATTLTTLDAEVGAAALAEVARAQGAATGEDARRTAGPRPGRRRSLAALLRILAGAGFQPEVEKASGTVRLRNCPYDALVTEHRDLTCGMNLAWAQGVVDGSGTQATVELDPAPGRCCVTFHTALGSA
jgi:predicted ArsR family transcriptional regulator